MCAAACNARAGCRVYAWKARILAPGGIVVSDNKCYTYNDVNNVFRPDAQSSSWKTCVQDDTSYLHDLETLVKRDPECYTLATMEDYTGTLSKTSGGFTCQSWAPDAIEQVVNDESCLLNLAYPGKGLGNHNHCRNPIGSPGGIWCYTTESTPILQLCTPPQARSNACSTRRSNLTEIYGGAQHVPAVKVKHFHWNNYGLFNDRAYGIDSIMWPYAIDRVESIDFTLARWSWSCGSRYGSGAPPSEHQVMHFDTQLNIPVSTYYSFYPEADDDAKLWVGGNELIHASVTSMWLVVNDVDASNAVFLNQGPVDVKVAFFNDVRDERVTMSWASPLAGIREQIITATEFVSPECYHCEEFRSMPGGLTADLFFSWTQRSAQGMGTATPDASRREDNIDFYWPTPFNDNTQSNHAIRYTGTLYIEQPGQYAFYVWVDDGFQLWIDNHLLAQRAGCLNSAAVEFRVEKQLEAGPHRLELYYYNCDGPERVRLSYECTLLGLTKRTIPPHAFVPATVNSLTAQYYDMAGQAHTSIPDLAMLVPTDTRKE